MSDGLGIPAEAIVSKIYKVRGKKVMLSSDLAGLYEVETKKLNQQVKRNIGRFPDRYMFQLTKEEYDSLRPQNVTLKRGRHSKYLPYAFTEYGILMLSSVLKSKRAEKVNILIIDTFVKLNQMLLTHKDILLKLEELEKKLTIQDEKVKMIFKYLKQFIGGSAKERARIGFKRGHDND